MYQQQGKTQGSNNTNPFNIQSKEMRETFLSFSIISLGFSRLYFIYSSFLFFSHILLQGEIK